MKIKVDDIILAPLTHQDYQPCKVKRILAQQKYLVLFLHQNTSAIVLGHSIRPFQSQQPATQIEHAIHIQQNGQQPVYLSEAGQTTDKIKREESTINAGGQSRSKVERLRMKKREKQERSGRQARPISSQLSRVASSRGQNSCSTLRLLLQKLGNEVSKSFRSTEEQISEYEIERLKKILNLSYPLNIYDIAKEWIVQAFILLIKEIKLWGIPRCPDLEHLTQDKFQQIKDFVLSEQFEGVDLPESKKKRILLKIRQNQLQIKL